MIKAYRDTWTLEIHSYLAYIRDRLIIAQQLLKDTGSIFVQIGEENVHLVRCLMDEVFGRDNFVRQITFAKTGVPLGSNHQLGRTSDYLIWYAQNRKNLKYNKIYRSEKTIDDHYKYVELPDGTARTITKQEKADTSLLPKGTKVYREISLSSQGEREGDSQFEFEGDMFRPASGGHWSVTCSEGLLALKKRGDL